MKKKKSGVRADLLILLLAAFALIATAAVVFLGEARNGNLEEKISEALGSDSQIELTDTAESETVESSEAVVQNTDIEDFVPLVGTNDVVDDTYFADALFIGSTQLDGLKNASGLSMTSDWMISSEYNVSNVMTLTVKDNLGNSTTVQQLLGSNTYAKIYIYLGFNELSSMSQDEITQSYSALIAQIKQMQPSAVIYVMGLTPVTTDYINQSGNANNYNIVSFNQAMYGICNLNMCYYIDDYGIFADGEGNLPSGYTSDGVNLNQSACVTWMDYLRIHHK